MDNTDILSCSAEKAFCLLQETFPLPELNIIQTIIRKCSWHRLAPKFTFQVGVRKRSGSRLLMSVTAESEACDYFGAKVQINPVWVTTLLMWTKCAVPCDLCWKTHHADGLSVSDNRCFFPLLLSAKALLSQKTPDFICTSGCVHIICQGVIRQVFRQIHKSLHGPTFWRLFQNVSRQMPFSSITFHLQVLNKWTRSSCSLQLH